MIKLCKDCKYSKPEPTSPWNLRCQHIKVNAKDPYALTQETFVGTNCINQRSKTWFAACGMAGKLWESK